MIKERSELDNENQAQKDLYLAEPDLSKAKKVKTESEERSGPQLLQEG